MEGSAPRNIVLTGFMGTGKTTVGRLLATLLDYEFVDTDAVIVERHGEIAEIFASRGEEEFRRIEREVAAELGGGERRVIATGGRLMLDPVAAESLGSGARVFCLTATPDTIAARVLTPADAARPLLAGPDPHARIVELLAERAAGYAQFEQVATDGLTASEVTHFIRDRIRSS